MWNGYSSDHSEFNGAYHRVNNSSHSDYHEVNIFEPKGRVTKSGEHFDWNDSP